MTVNRRVKIGVEAKRSTGDYHHRFNACHFQEWWQKQRLPNLPSRCVIVIDRATFHWVPEEQILSQSMRKAELQAWLTTKQIPWEEHWLKPKRLEEVNKHLDKTPVVQKVAEAQGHQRLLLPVHHPELNPIELVWAIVKNECGRLLRQGVKFSEVREHLEQAFDKVAASTCGKLYHKIQQQEELYWATDVEIDNIEDENPEAEADNDFILE